MLSLRAGSSKKNKQKHSPNRCTDSIARPVATPVSLVECSSITQQSHPEASWQAPTLNSGTLPGSRPSATRSRRPCTNVTLQVNQHKRFPHSDDKAGVPQARRTPRQTAEREAKVSHSTIALPSTHNVISAKRGRQEKTDSGLKAPAATQR